MQLKSPESLPETSTLGALYKRIARVDAYVREKNARLRTLETEHQDVRYRIDTSTLENTTPEAYSLEVAREVLLTRSIKIARQESKQAESSFQDAEIAFNREYDSYRRLVERYNKMLPAPASNGYMTDEERERRYDLLTLERAIADVSN